jgi:hypothetical protein
MLIQIRRKWFNLLGIYRTNVLHFVIHVRSIRYLANWTCVPVSYWVNLWRANAVFISFVLLIALLSKVRAGTDKSLARPTSRCRRTESIVSLERGFWSRAEFKSCYEGWKEACQATRAISTSRRELSSWPPPPPRQGTQVNTHHSDRNIRGACTIVYNRQKMGGLV